MKYVLITKFGGIIDLVIFYDPPAVFASPKFKSALELKPSNLETDQSDTPH